MAPNLAYKFQMICFRRTLVIELKLNVWHTDARTWVTLTVPQKSSGGGIKMLTNKLALLSVWRTDVWACVQLTVLKKCSGGGIKMLTNKLALMSMWQIHQANQSRLDTIMIGKKWNSVENKENLKYFIPFLFLSHLILFLFQVFFS